MATVHLEHAYAKLTRSLEITGRRADGYHLLRAEMVSLDLCDDLVIEEGGSGIVVEDAIDWRFGSGPPLEVPDDRQNLIQKALDSLGRQAFVRLVKRIPPGAGLGGGSSDAASVLRRYGVADVSRAAALGADVPFCLRGGRAVVTGIGDEIRQLRDVELGFVVVTPSFGVSTQKVYAMYDQIGPPGPGAANHLEPAALRVEPRLQGVRDVLAAASDRPATLAGSGSSYFVECAREETHLLAAKVSAAFAKEGEPVLISACQAVTCLSG